MFTRKKLNYLSTTNKISKGIESSSGYKKNESKLNYFCLLIKTEKIEYVLFTRKKTKFSSTTKKTSKGIESSSGYKNNESKLNYLLLT